MSFTRIRACNLYEPRGEDANECPSLWASSMKRPTWTEQDQLLTEEAKSRHVKAKERARENIIVSHTVPSMSNNRSFCPVRYDKREGCTGNTAIHSKLSSLHALRWWTITSFSSTLDTEVSTFYRLRVQELERYAAQGIRRRPEISNSITAE